MGFWWVYRPIVIMVTVLANGPGDQGSIPGQVIPKTKKNDPLGLLA